MTMSIDALRDNLPAYAKDISLNLSSLMSDQTLSDQQKWGSFLACAHMLGNASLLSAVTQQSQAHLSPEAVTAAKAASTIMGMNNIYYRSLHLMHNNEYTTLPAKLRMNILGAPGIDKVDFELYCFAVSAINGCGACLDSHEKVLRSHEVTNIQVQTALRIASVLHAAAVVLRAEGL
jgi:alkyl hydroperoxide reductase subunit D